MKRRLLLFFALFCVSVGTWAAITISTATVTVGGTQYSGYGIYGAKEGEIAKLLNGDNSVTVQWNGASLSDLTSAEYIKVGSTSQPNVLGNADLAALELLSGAKFLDIDGSVLAEGAVITNIKAGSAIEAVSLPGGLTKEQVNDVGAALAGNTHPNFGSCLSLNGEMEEKVITTYTYTVPCSSEVVEYTGTVTDGKGHIEINRPLTLTGSSATFINTKFKHGGEGEVTPVEPSLIDENGYVEPSPLKVELTPLDNPKTVYTVEVNGKTYTVGEYAVDTETQKIKQEVSMWDGELNQNVVIPVGTNVTVKVVRFTYTFMKGGWEQPIDFDGEEQGTATDGYYCMVENNYVPNNQGYHFKATVTYNYTYTDLDCNEATISYKDGPHETINLSNNYEVDLTATTLTIHVPKEGVECEAIAYVKTPGTLYKATSLDSNDAAKATSLVISGNINNGDLAWGVGTSSADPQYNQGDADKYEPNGAIPAVSAFNSAPKSVDLSDAVLEDGNYRYLRVLNGYAAKLESVVFPKTLDRIPNYCCYSLGDNGCKNLSNVVFPTKATSFTIGDYAFHHTAITSLLIPGAVTNIGDRAFATCDKITDIEMEPLKSTCHFGNYVFANCSALKHVTLSEKVENIGDYQFNQCGLMESIRIPSTCKVIGEMSFYECFSIHQMTIPEGVELIKVNAFELSGLTDIYVMATSPDKVPKIYAQSATKGQEGGPSTFSYQRTTGFNTVPKKSAEEWSNADYDEVMTWYQEEQSGSKGLGTDRCLLALHYPESMKPFYEAIDITQAYTTEELERFTANGLVNYFTPAQYLDFIENDQTKAQVQGDITNRRVQGTTVTDTEATRLVDPETHQELPLLYLPQTYAIDPYQDGSNPLQGPDMDNRYYPSQSDMVVRMVAGATGVNSGADDNIASQWGWRQFPLSSSVESIGETPFEKEYDDTWYTMCFPWKMVDNQLFSAFNQKLEIVEFMGAELLEDEESSTETVQAYNLVFHFDKVAATYYMDDNNVEYTRERDGDRVDAAGHKLYIYTNKTNPSDVVTCPTEVTSQGYNPSTASNEVKEAYGRYLSIQNIMVLPGHPYMIHPSIGAAPGSPAKVYINGVKKIVPGEGLYTNYSTLAAVAESEKVARVVTSNEAGGESTEAWKNPVTGVGGTYTFIGNINDAVETDGVSDNGVQDMPTENGPVYFLGVKPGTVYPQYFKKAKGKGQGKWSQYSAIIVPDADAIANVEGLDGMTVGGSAAPAKGYDVVFGEWEIVEPETVTTAIESAIAEEKESGKPAQIVHMNVVYNINGQVVRTDSTSVEGLPKGLYIVNGKKYMVK